MDYFNLLAKILREGKEISPRGQKVIEIINAQLVIDEYNYPITRSRSWEDTSKYWFGELAWYFSGDCRTDLILPYSKFWGKISQDGYANSNYGHLVFYKGRGPFRRQSGYSWALQSIKDDWATRQAIITYNDGDYNYKGNNDYICSQQQHFLMRDNKLYCMVYLRSSDAIYGLQYNMPWWSIVQQQLCHDLQDTYPGLQIGTIYVTIGSSHLYEQHIDLAYKMTQENNESVFVKLKERVPLMKGNFDWYEKNIAKYLEGGELG